MPCLVKRDYAGAMIKPLLVFFAGTLLLGAIAKSETLPEARAKFSAADALLNQAYQKAKEEMPEWRLDTLQEEQREWLSYRDSRSEAAAALEGQAREGEEKSNVEYWVAMTYLTETRIAIVEAWMKIDENPGEWEGVWSDGYGGELAIFETGGRSIEFFLEVVRGPTYHLGSIGGIAETNEHEARFSIQEESVDKPTWLTFHHTGGRIKVSGVNTQMYHGARAYFDGTYIRVRELTAEDRKRIEEQGGY
ncbi:MAG: lysozyme inhibitor LprI family protein [Verrucomicrobiota bacterium]